MGYEVEITRNPDFTKRPGVPITLDEWFAIILNDDELRLDTSFEPEGYPPTGAMWIAHPDQNRDSETQCLHAVAGSITTKYPDEALLAKMVRIARKLNALVIGDNGELYDLDTDGRLICADEVPEPPPKPRPFIYGPGIRPCREYNAATSQIFYNWYLGLLTSFNFTRHAKGEDPVNYLLTVDRMREDSELLTAFCARHPDKQFIEAAMELIRLRDLHQTLPKRPA